MSNYDLFTDSGCDFPNSIPSDISIIPIKVTFGDEDLPPDSALGYFFHRLATEKATTAAPSDYEIAECLRPSLQAGRDVLYVTMTTTLSSTYEHSQTAAINLRQEFPNRRVECIDSRCVSGGQALMITELLRLREYGATIDRLIKFIDDNWRKVMHIFTVDNLDCLYRGGRVSRTKYRVASTLNVVPLMHLDSNCELSAIKNVRFKKACKESAKIVDGTIAANSSTVWLHHGNCPDQAEEYRDALEKHDLNVIYGDKVRIGGVIASHTGGTVKAKFYWGNDRNDALDPKHQ